ncbi:MAG TPA: ATP-binding protein [Vicinamibacteria bacterium]|nr:ATP-binding protein [Vicinamibacteria bacterium]
MRFVNREEELLRLADWWSRPGSLLGLVWGRRRVGKTALLNEFAKDRRVVFHTASSRPVADELKVLSRLVDSASKPFFRDLGSRPFVDWDDCFDTLAELSRREPMLLVLDEFPELKTTSPELESVLRAFWERVRNRTLLRILICGSAVRTMEAIQEERAPLYGRFDLSLHLHPFSPHEASKMLPRLKPADRALVWGLVGGVPLYLEWWDEASSVRKNLERLVCTPGGALLTEGDLILAREGGSGDLTRQVLFAVAAGRTKYNEIEQAIGTSPHRIVENLIQLRLLERLSPVTEVSQRTRRSSYRIADNFLAFWLGVVSKYRAEIDRGLGRTILNPLIAELDDYMGPRWEDAFREHLRRLAARGELAEDVVAVGSFWSDGVDPVEIDAVVLAGRSRKAILVGEAKWAREVDGERVGRVLRDKARRLPTIADELVYAVCAREKVNRSKGLKTVTARQIFGR